MPNWIERQINEMTARRSNATNTQSNLGLDALHTYTIQDTHFDQLQRVDYLGSPWPQIRDEHQQRERVDLDTWVGARGERTPISELNIEHLKNIVAKMGRQPNWRPEFRRVMREELRRRHQLEKQKELEQEMGSATIKEKVKKVLGDTNADSTLEKRLTSQMKSLTEISVELQKLYDGFVDAQEVLAEETMDDVFGLSSMRKQVTYMLGIIDKWKEMDRSAE